MRRKAITVNLMGGLGNQMFQYAAGRALTIRNSAKLYLDTMSEFERDTVYRRSYELDVFPIRSQKTSLFDQLPHWFERGRNKLLGVEPVTILERPWGSFIRETKTRYLDEVANYRTPKNIWMNGYWQSEKYFADVKDIIGRELTPPVPTEPRFLKVAKAIESCNSVAVGVRLFEEVPGATKVGVGGLTPMAFYEGAANHLACQVADPTFFVFCTVQSPILREVKFPGQVHYITHDNGFEGAVSRLWLISRCAHHILANSSFYWWGAWLAERERSDSKIIASSFFPNCDTVPERWLTESLISRGIVDPVEKPGVSS